MATGNRHEHLLGYGDVFGVRPRAGRLAGMQAGETRGDGRSTPAGGVKAVPAANKEPAKNPIETAASLFREPKESIQNIVKAANDRWTPVCSAVVGQARPGLHAHRHRGPGAQAQRLRGKDVVVVFFATWAGACKMEVPQLKELRNAYPKDKLAILAISSEPTALVKTFAAEQGVNYTVLTNSGTLPTPFDQVKVSPSSVLRWCRRQVQAGHRRNGSGRRRQGDRAGTVGPLASGGCSCSLRQMVASERCNRSRAHGVSGNCGSDVMTAPKICRKGVDRGQTARYNTPFVRI